ncbi:unnamed protein product [Blepharisma stoltei]|uniref:Uncharacterized protein n=1 Tax=Blepharisma stoltei TaxID=1481888 RepID=A0AAU9JJA2_9CILI|nr:unnamed protein product [Blepharisma stoltei]
MDTTVRETKTLERLTQIDPQEWTNIPIPIKSALSMIIKLLADHQQSILSIKSTLGTVIVKANKRKTNFLKAIEATNEQLSKKEEEILLSISRGEQENKQNIDKINEEIRNDRESNKKVNDQLFQYMKAESKDLNQKIEALPTKFEVHSKIQEIKDNMPAQIKGDIEKQFEPEILGMYKRIDETNTYIRDKAKSLENLINKEKAANSEIFGVINKRIDEEKQKYEEGLKEAREETQKGIEMMETLLEYTQTSFGNKFQIKNTYHIDLQKKIDELNALFSKHQAELEDLKVAVSEIEPPAPKEEIQISSLNLGEIDILKIIKENQPPPPPPGLSMDEVRKEIEEISKIINAELKNTLKEQELKFSKDLNDSIQNLETWLKSEASNTGVYIKELRDKLAWLPMNLSQLEGMSATEARLFTLEARLRSEENSKLQIYNALSRLIESKFVSQKSSRPESLTPQIPLGRYSASPYIREPKEEKNRFNESLHIIEDSEISHTKNETTNTSRISRRQSPLNFTYEKTQKVYKEMRKLRETPGSYEFENSQRELPNISIKRQTMRL